MDGVIQPIQTLQQPLVTTISKLDQRNRPNIVAVDADSLPHGWERVIDENHGIYYIDHNNQRTQYERPYEIELTKSLCGFGFTLVEAEKGILTVRSIIHGGPAHLNGTIQPGDVLISVVGVCVSGRQHTEVARLFAKFAVGDRVKLTFARGNTRYTDPSFLPHDYLIAESINFNNSNLLPTSASLQDYSLANGFSHQPAVIDTNYDLVSVTLKKGKTGFGFTISDASSGQKVKIILDNNRCVSLRQGDILMNLNGVDISNLAHKEVVEALKQCKIDEEATLVVKRKRRFRSKTPMDTHSTGALGFYHEKMLPQRNCKTPSLEVMMMHRNNDNNEWAGDLDANPRIQWTSLANINGFDMYKGSNGQGLLRNNVSLPSHITTNGIQNGISPTIPMSRTYNHPLRLNTEPYSLVPPAQQLTAADYNLEESNSENLYQNSLELQRLAIESSMSTDIYENGSHLINQTIQPTLSQGGIDPIYLSATHHPERDGQPWNTSNISPSHLINLHPNQQLSHMNPYMTTTDEIKENNGSMMPKDANVGALPSNCIYHDPLYSNTVMMGYHPSHLNDDLQVLPEPIERSTTNASVATIANQSLYGILPSIVDSRSQYLLNNDDNNNVNNNEQFTTIPPNFMPITIQKDEMIDPGTETTTSKIDPSTIEYEYHNVVLDRGENGFGFRIMGGAEADRIISIGSIVIGGVAHKNGKLKAGDEIISINNHDVMGATHEHVVGLMSACTTNVSLLVRRKKHSDAYDVVLSRSLEEGFGFVIISCGNCALIGKIILGSPADRCQRLHVRDRIIAVNGRDITAMTHPEIVNMIKESGATLKLRIIPSNCYSVELIRSVKGFGFSIRGGAEFNGMPLYILRVAIDGPAQDLLNVGDEIIEINNISTIGMTHQQAVNIISHSEPLVKLKLRRNYVTPTGLLADTQSTE